MNIQRYKRLRPKQFHLLKIIGVVNVIVLIFSIIANKYFNMKKTIIICSIGVLLVIIIASKNSKTRKYSYLIENFIKSNNLFQVYYDKNGKEKIGYYPHVEYMIKNNLLYLKWRLDGSLIAQKLRNIEQALADCLCTLCVDVIEERGFITFIFELSMPKQDIIYSFKEIPILEEGKITLSNIVIDWKKCPHMLIVGQTGSGKTFCAQYIMYALREQGVRVIYCDPKNDAEMKWFCKVNDIKYFNDINTIGEIVRETEEEMRLREKDLDNMGLEEAEFNPVYLFFDELIAFSKIVNKKTYEEVSKRLSSIIVQGRQKRVYAGVLMQRPDISFIDGATRDNFCIRIYMGTGKASETTNKMIFGADFSHVQNYRTEKGSGLIYRVGVDKRVKELLVPYFENSNHSGNFREKETE